MELYNPLAVPVNLSGMGLSDSPDSPHRFVFPEGSVIAGGGYAVFECDPGRPASATNTGFGLKASGDALYLHDARARGGALLDGIVFGLQAPDLALSRNPLAHAAWSPSEPTPGAVNRPLATGMARTAVRGLARPTRISVGELSEESAIAASLHS